MSTRLKQKREKLEQLITRLVEEGAKGTPVVVEGKKDAQALRELGVNGSIITVKTGGKSFLKASLEIEGLGVSTVILLLDFDRRGKEGTLRLQRDLERAKIKVDTRFWLQLQALIGREIQCIESLPSYLKTLQQKSE
ncbi:MAG TPA: toprim domain-containing protein [Candidatus Limnocylindrales bacterium]|nr:toprim domain-containing protein [Candidatus Limnocylindrales bacterium]